MLDEWGRSQSPLLLKGFPTSVLEHLRPPRDLVAFLSQKCLESVEPTLKVQHAPTVQRQILNNSQSRETLNPPVQCLITRLFVRLLWQQWQGKIVGLSLMKINMKQ